VRNGKDGFIERYGGFRFPETQEEAEARIRRMDELYAKRPKTPADIEELARLKGNADQP
jgi:hypothetical protein